MASTFQVCKYGIQNGDDQRIASKRGINPGKCRQASTGAGSTLQCQGFEVIGIQTPPHCSSPLPMSIQCHKEQLTSVSKFPLGQKKTMHKSATPRLGKNVQIMGNDRDSVVHTPSLPVNIDCKLSWRTAGQGQCPSLHPIRKLCKALLGGADKSVLTDRMSQTLAAINARRLMEAHARMLICCACTERPNVACKQRWHDPQTADCKKPRWYP